jgi:broad specificity phosphatase PhoE
MAKLWLVRHGQTDWNIEGRWQGQANPPLNIVGYEQAQALVKELAGLEFEAIYSSDLQRATETALLIAKNKGLSVQTDSRLREINLGEWEGMLGTEIAQKYPAFWAERENNPLGSHPPGGESIMELARRVIPAMSEISEKHLQGSVLVVSHGLALAVFLCHVHNLPLQQAFQQIPENARPIIVDGQPPIFTSCDN